MKRRNPLAWLVLALLVLAALAGAVVVWIRLATQGSQAPRRLEALRAQGQPVLLADLAGPAVPDDRNAAAGLAGLAPEIKPLEPAVNAFLVDADKLSWPTPEQVAAATGALAGQEPLFAKLAEVVARPAYRPTADYTKPPSAVTADALDRQQQNRLVLRLLMVRARTQLAAGQLVAARQSCLTMLRLARQLEGEPFLNGYLVACAARRSAVQTLATVLAAGEPSRDERQTFEAELAQHGPRAALRRALASERTFGIVSFEEIKSASSGWLMDWYWDDDLARYLELIDDAANDTGPTALGRQATAEETGMAAYLGRLTQNVRPAVTAARQASDRDLANLRCVRILLALSGRSPQGPPPVATELGLPAAEVADPYSSSPLLVRVGPQGWTVYSVGPDGRDDGGDAARDLALPPKNEPPAR
jgi:hypothetical protein